MLLRGCKELQVKSVAEIDFEETILRKRVMLVRDGLQESQR